MTPKDFNRILMQSRSKGKRRNKYGAKKTIVDGIKFDSKREARRYRDLKIMERAGEISSLKLQPKFPIVIDGKPVKIKSEGFPNGRAVAYFADFSYEDENLNLVVEDSKGLDTPVSKLKRAMVETIYGVKVKLV